MAIFKMKISGYVLRNKKGDFLAPLGLTTEKIENAYVFYRMAELKARIPSETLKELTIVPLYNFNNYKEAKNDNISGISEEAKSFGQTETSGFKEE